MVLIVYVKFLIRCLHYIQKTEFNWTEHHTVLKQDCYIDISQKLFKANHSHLCLTVLQSLITGWLTFFICLDTEMHFNYLSPFCTTRFLQVLQQEHAWLHSKMRGGSSRQNSGRRRPFWTRKKMYLIVDKTEGYFYLVVSNEFLLLDV